MNKFAKGWIYAIATFTAWGLLPIYWKQLKNIPALEILAHRIFWSFLFCFVVILVKRQGREMRVALRSSVALKSFAFSGLLIGINWLTYILAVNHGFILEASLGYFLTPLVNVGLGLFFLKETLSRLQWLSVTFALMGVLTIANLSQRFPWFSLVLALSFGFYGLARKNMPISALAASTLESLIILPVAIGYFVKLGKGAATLQASSTTIWLLVLSGVITGLPLIWFAHAAKNLKLSTLGFFQYLTPTLQFFLAVFYYHEAFTIVQACGFLLVWMGVALFLCDSWMKRS